MAELLVEHREQALNAQVKRFGDKLPIIYV